MAASRHFVNLFLLLYSPVGEYKRMHVILDPSKRRISYVHLCKNTLYSPTLLQVNITVKTSLQNGN